MNYTDVTLKEPREDAGYGVASAYAIKSIENIMFDAINRGDNKIIINTNLKLGLPMENINKIAGPFVEAWACEKFIEVLEIEGNRWKLVNAEALERLNRADILLQFRKDERVDGLVTAEVDVKATSEEIEGSGKSPNITSFARIRSAYVENPNYIFIILSLKHTVSSLRNPTTKLMDGIMEIVKYNAYDIKYLSDSDISYNPALGTGQIQIKDIHYVATEIRTALDFCKLLDKKYLASSKRTDADWLALANKHGWIK
jgi:hypothetical protein